MTTPTRKCSWTATPACCARCTSTRGLKRHGSRWHCNRCHTAYVLDRQAAGLLPEAALLSPKTLTAWCSAADRVGVAPAEYIRRRAAGERWCGYHKTFHPGTEFTGNAALCREGFRVLYSGGTRGPRGQALSRNTWLVYVADPAQRCDRLHRGALCEASARALAHSLNAAAMRDWRPGQPQPALYYAVAGSEEVT